MQNCSSRWPLVAAALPLWRGVLLLELVPWVYQSAEFYRKTENMGKLFFHSRFGVCPVTYARRILFEVFHSLVAHRVFCSHCQLFSTTEFVLTFCCNRFHAGSLLEGTGYKFGTVQKREKGDAKWPAHISSSSKIQFFISFNHSGIIWLMLYALPSVTLLSEWHT